VTLGVEDAAAPEIPDDPPGSEAGTPCPEPAGGWAAEEPRRGSDEHVKRAADVARREPDFSGLWVDQYGGHPYGSILIVAFTGDLDRHERDLREVWGGPLCMVEHERSQRDLRIIRKDLYETVADLGLEVLWSDTDVKAATVEIGVVFIDDATRAELDERYGPGAVEVHAALRPVE
jgi:hypothetical protein